MHSCAKLIHRTHALVSRICHRLTPYTKQRISHILWPPLFSLSHKVTLVHFRHPIKRKPINKLTEMHRWLFTLELIVFAIDGTFTRTISTNTILGISIEEFEVFPAVFRLQPLFLHWILIERKMYNSMYFPCLCHNNHFLLRKLFLNTFAQHLAL